MALRKLTETRTVNGPYSSVQVVTLTGFDGTDSFKLTYNGTETAAFVRGTNATAAAIQTALRTATGDTGLTVSGNTDAGPFTVTFVNKTGTSILDILTVTSPSGCTGAVTANLDNKAPTMRTALAPYLIRRIVPSTTSAGSPTYEVKENGPGTTELADESPADVTLTIPDACDGVYSSAAHQAANTLSDGDTITFTYYYESRGDYRF